MLSAELKAEADNTYRDLDNFRLLQKPNLIIVLLYIVLKKKRQTHCTQFNIALGNHALRAQPTDESLIC